MLPYSNQYAEAGFLLVVGILVEKLSRQSHDIDRLQGTHCVVVSSGLQSGHFEQPPGFFTFLQNQQKL
jgi:hypothetical protein